MLRFAVAVFGTVLLGSVVFAQPPAPCMINVQVQDENGVLQNVPYKVCGTVSFAGCVWGNPSTAACGTPEGEGECNMTMWLSPGADRNTTRNRQRGVQMFEAGQETGPDEVFDCWTDGSCECVLVDYFMQCRRDLTTSGAQGAVDPYTPYTGVGC